MTDQTILATPPSNLDESELTDALAVAPPSVRSRRVTRALSALLLVALGATGATWWAQRDGSTSAASSGRPSFGSGELPTGFPSGAPGGGTSGTGTTGTGTTGTGTTGTGTTGTGTSGTGTSGTSALSTTGEVVLVDGAKVYVRTSTGAVVTVTTTGSTSVRRSVPSTVAKLATGDTVTVTGATTSSGVTATAITAS